jgi:hypothetical protein
MLNRIGVDWFNRGARGIAAVRKSFLDLTARR